MSMDAGELIDLAQDQDVAARGRLLTTLARLVLTPEDRPARARELFYDIARVLIERVPEIDRAHLAEIASDFEAFPRDLALALARDSIAVAEPLLMRGEAFHEDDLVAIASDCGDAHRTAIATRRLVSRRLTRVLIRLGGGEVLRRLGANRGADFFDEDVRELHLRAESDATLGEILRARDDLRAALLRAMRQMMEQASAPHGARGGRPHHTEKPGVAPATSRIPSPGEVAVGELVDRVRAGAKSLDAAVVELADADRHADLAVFLGRIADIDETGVLRVLVRSDVDGIALLAGGLAVAEAAFERVIELRRRKLRFSASQARWERDAYRKIDRRNARSTLDQLGGHRRRAG